MRPGESNEKSKSPICLVWGDALGCGCFVCFLMFEVVRISQDVSDFKSRNQGFQAEAPVAGDRMLMIWDPSLLGTKTKSLGKSNIETRR